MTPTNPELRKFILQFFSDEGLETLCFDYFPEATNEFGGGMSKNRKVIVLISHCEHRSRLADLHAAVARERPEEWNRQFTAADVQKPGLSEETRFPDERDPRQIFLSHATVDAEFAHTLAADLRVEGWKVWIAPDSIRPGEKWLEAINRGLETSGVFVVALTPAAVASRWVRTETNAAVGMEHRDLIRLFPLDVAECEPPWLWTQYQYLPFRDGYQVGLDALLRQLDGPSHTAFVTPAPPLPRTPASLPDRRIHEKTGIELIRIPAGSFLYGSANSDAMAYKNEKPQRTIELPEYWIGRYPVTNAQYKRFVENTNHRAPSHWNKKVPPPEKLEHPVVQVSWDDAKAFCDWAGLTLPTERYWEKAARGTDGRIWPWGDELPTNKHCNFDHNVGDTTPVGRYSPLGDSPYGCADMAGNVLEWTGSWYKEGSTLALRGGSWLIDDRDSRAAYRNDGYPDFRLKVIGFRVVELLSDPVS